MDSLRDRAAGTAFGWAGVQVETDLLLMEAYDEVGEAVQKMPPGTAIRVAFVIRGWRWYLPEREARYLLRLTAFCIEPASL